MLEFGMGLRFSGLMKVPLVTRCRGLRLLHHGGANMNFPLQAPVLIAIFSGILSCKGDKPGNTKKETAETKVEASPAADVVMEKRENTATGGYATVDLQRLVRESKAGLAGGQRLDAFKALMEESLAKRNDYPEKILAEMEIIQQQLKSAKPGSSEQKKWAGMFESTKAELTALAKDREEFAKRRNQQLKEFSLLEIKRVISLASVQLGELAKERGYVWVMDKSGLSAGDVPVILYTKEKHPDITNEMLRRMDAAFSGEKAED